MIKNLPEPKVLYKDENVIAIDKPAGLMVHSARVAEGKRGKGFQGRIAEPTLVDWLLARYPEIKTVGDDPVTRPGIVHRLDKETSGVILIARTQAYFEYLKSLFQNRDIEKVYYAIVAGVPKKEEGIIDAPIGIKNGTLKRSVHSEKMAKEAITEYKVLKTFTKETDIKETEKLKNSKTEKPEMFSLLEVHPKTGRTHQIRVHLASIGHPIVGDPLYGSKKQPSWVTRLMLHAFSVTFQGAPGKMIAIESLSPFRKYVESRNDN
jgi:23S rRNA pseudouridine1911/1915/1917 synthase